MKRFVVAVALTLTGMLMGCASAPIALPEGLAGSTEALPVTGMGFGEQGRFALGESFGTFVRHKYRSGAQHVPSATGLTHAFGDSTFRVSGPDFGGVVEAVCTYGETAINVGVEATVRPFQYSCRFSRNGAPLSAGLVLRTVPRAAGMLTTETRAGEFFLDGRSIQIEAIHESPNMIVAAGDPLGYRFDRNGRPVGAVDLNGERKTIFAPIERADREAVLLAGLALSVLWNP